MCTTRISVKVKEYLSFQAEVCIRDRDVTGVQTCALPISARAARAGCDSAVSREVGHDAGRLPSRPATKSAISSAACVPKPGDDSANVRGDPERRERGPRSEERRVGKEWRSSARVSLRTV